ncbi:MAG: HD domain-containing protein [Planctomycetaceae bacterium]|nr:HD domain-containing protein [Planctomycetaceae bacterium]
MDRQYVNTLSDGQSVDEYFLLADKQLRANRNAETYLLVQLRDRTGQISGFLWNVREDVAATVSTGEIVLARGRVQLYQGNLQMILTHIEPAERDDLDMVDYIPESSQNTGELLEKLRSIMSDIEDEDLKALMQTFLDDTALVEQLCRCPAGIKLHHAFHGGLLEHIVNLMLTARQIRDLYPAVNFDLLTVGIFLHDLGKTRELEYESTFSYSDEGQLIGHLVQGVEMLNEKVLLLETSTGRPFPTEMLLRIKHMIVSHHGSYEYGSPKLPMTPEAIALHHLDNLDAKLNEFQSLIDSDPNSDSVWTPYNTNLQRKIFKGVPAED